MCRLLYFKNIFESYECSEIQKCAVIIHIFPELTEINFLTNMLTWPPELISKGIVLTT